MVWGPKPVPLFAVQRLLRPRASCFVELGRFRVQCSRADKHGAGFDV